MKFRVNLGWREDYLFDSADEAVRFGITAKVKREDHESPRVAIDLLSDSDLEAERREKEAAND